MYPMVIRFPILMGDTLLGAMQVAAVCKIREDAEEEGRELIFAMVLPHNATEQDIDELEALGTEIFKPFYTDVSAVVIPKYFVAGIIVADW